MSKIRKALMAGIAAGLAAIAQAAATTGLAHINWAVVAGAVVAAGYAVWQTKNAKNTPAA
jgi:hypothetical protein